MAAIRNIRRRARRQRRQNRLVIERPRLNEEYNDVDFFARYRFRQGTVYFIVGLLNLAYPTEKNRPLSPFLQVCVTLRYLAGAGIQQLCADVHDISTSSVCRTVWRVINQLISPAITSRFIKFPQNVVPVQQGFYSLASEYLNYTTVQYSLYYPYKSPFITNAEFQNPVQGLIYIYTTIMPLWESSFVVFKMVEFGQKLTAKLTLTQSTLSNNMLMFWIKQLFKGYNKVSVSMRTAFF